MSKDDQREKTRLRVARHRAKKKDVTPCNACSDIADTDTDTKADTGRKKRTRATFTPPTVDEIRAYVTEKGYTFDPETFHAYYDSQGWKKANGQPVSSWKGCCVTFQKGEPAKSPPADAWHGIWSIEDEGRYHHLPTWRRYTQAMHDWQGANKRPTYDEWKMETP
jgi:hypothetical protein